MLKDDLLRKISKIGRSILKFRSPKILRELRKIRYMYKKFVTSLHATDGESRCAAFRPGLNRSVRATVCPSQCDTSGNSARCLEEVDSGLMTGFETSWKSLDETSRQFGIALEEVCLTFSDEMLTRGRSLESYGICDGSDRDPAFDAPRSRHSTS
jgi:hypothetical protein